MLYFKHKELVEKYRVSLKTVHNWIDGAKGNKIDLKLIDHNTRTYIANTQENVLVLSKLAAKGKKYRNTLHRKVVTPKSEFYDLYSRRQILDIISNLTIHHEIPRQYNYMEDGARSWDELLKRREKDTVPNQLLGTIDLIKFNFNAIDRFIDGHKRVNIIDLGVGNARPVKELLEHLLEKNILHRYIAIDISKTMLEIAERNINKWFGDKIQFEGYIRDISYERFDDLIVDDMLDNDADDTINLVLLLGATPVNFPSFSDVFKVVYRSVGNGDLLIYTYKRDTEETRRHFDFHPKPDTRGLSPIHAFILDQLNIDDSLYDVEMGYNDQMHMRYVRIRLKTALTIKFEFSDGHREVNLEKGSTILLLRVWHMSAHETLSVFEEAGYTLLQSSLTNDRNYFFTILGVDTKPISKNALEYPMLNRD